MMAGQQWTQEEIREECERKAEAERAEFCRDKPPEPEEPHACTFETSFVLKCLYQNQVGDAELFKRLHRGRFLFDHAGAAWFKWAGHFWEQDKTETVVAAMQGVCRVYETELQRISWRANQARGKKDDG